MAMIGTLARRPFRHMTERQRRENISGYLFMAPWLIGILFITIGPMIASAYLSFTEYNILSPPTWIGPQNFVGCSRRPSSSRR